MVKIYPNYLIFYQLNVINTRLKFYVNVFKLLFGCGLNGLVLREDHFITHDELLREDAYDIGWLRNLSNFSMVEVLFYVVGPLLGNNNG